MFTRRRSRSRMFEMPDVDSCEVRHMLKVAAMGYVAYKAARYVVREVLD